MKNVISNNSASYFSVIIAEMLGKILYFPVWWYTVGLFKKIKSLLKMIKDREKNIGLSVWVKNIFVPMYGQYDFSGRMISFFIRFFQILYRSFVMLFWIFVAIISVLFWIAIPAFIVFALIFQIF
ncbi:MAG: hypothetical protein PF488_00905 [Patescibacteria group bacterium]|jgi:hypothetical protein|nr:hypothetical protein [Patescibacteria group bacterium]